MKPQVVGDVLKEIKPALGRKTLIISVAASVPTSNIEQRAGAKVPVIRAMPNTCSIVGCGMTGTARVRTLRQRTWKPPRPCSRPSAARWSSTKKTWSARDRPVASGPAFVYIILESLAEAGVKVGLARDIATLLAARCMKGAASVVLERAITPLCSRIPSPRPQDAPSTASSNSRKGSCALR